MCKPVTEGGIMRFKDRHDAGRLLAQQLSAYKGADGLVYALPRGGVVLGVEAAKALDMPLDLLIPRKVGHPSHSEYAICAVTEDGHRFCNDEALINVDEEWLEGEIKSQQQEAKRRREEYLAGREPLPIEGKTAVIVDDGIATGLTMLAAIAQVRDRNPAKIVVAIPVVPPDTAEMLKGYADDLIAVDIPDYYLGAVGAYYEQFDQVEDDEVKGFLSQIT